MTEVMQRQFLQRSGALDVVAGLVLLALAAVLVVVAVVVAAG